MRKKVKNKFKGNNKTDKNALSRFVEERFVPALNKFTNFSILLTIRDAFGLLLPLIIVGSIGILGSTFIFGGAGAMSTSIIGWLAYWSDAVKINTGEKGQKLWELQGSWKDVSNIGIHLFKYIQIATIDGFSLYITFFIAWRWAKLHECKNSVLAGITALASFLIITQVDQRFFGATGLIAAMFIGFFSAWLFVVFDRSEKIKVKMPKSVPQSVATGFSTLFPILFVLLIASSINVLSYCTGYYGIKGYLTRNNYVWDVKISGEILEHGTYGFAGLIYSFISAPFISIASRSDVGLGIGLVYMFAISILWWFGIHGPAVLAGIFSPIWLSLIQNNYNSFQQHHDKFHKNLNVVNWAFLETYAMSTGVGIAGALIIATTIFSRKNKKFMQVNKIAAPAAIFNISEPVTFGYPLVLDPILGVASIFTMPLATLYAWIFVGPLGVVAKSYIYVPWTMPIGLGAFLSTGLDWRALLLSLSVLPLCVAFYIPFVLVKNKLDSLTEMKTGKTDKKMSFEESEKIFSEAKD